MLRRTSRSTADAPMDAVYSRRCLRWREWVAVGEVVSALAGWGKKGKCKRGQGQGQGQGWGVGRSCGAILFHSQDARHTVVSCRDWRHRCCASVMMGLHPDALVGRWLTVYWFSTYVRWHLPQYWRSCGEGVNGDVIVPMKALVMTRMFSNTKWIAKTTEPTVGWGSGNAVPQALLVCHIPCGQP